MSKASKFDLNVEAECRQWIQQLTGEVIAEYELEKRIKDGVILCKFMQKLFQGTPTDTLPPKCRTTGLKYKVSERPAVQMGNIEIFLNGCEAYGVQQQGLFAPSDLFEGRNMPMVMATILQLGSEAQRHKFDGPTCGSKPTLKKPKNKFTRAQLRDGHSILSLQQGTNKFASQKGMSFGSVRHCADIRADDQSQESQGDIGLQGGTNIFASQKGMSFGSVRHCADIRSDDFCTEGQNELTLQGGTNKFASQQGMSFGSVRHCADIRADDMNQESNADVGLQMGSNKFASQKGMRIGAVRHVADIKTDDMHQDSSGFVQLQSGSNKGASQSGMRGFGACRHVSDIKVTELADELEPEEGEYEEEDEQEY